MTGFYKKPLMNIAQLQAILKKDHNISITKDHIRKLAQKMGDKIARNPSGSGWLLTKTAIEFIKNQPKPGPKKRKK